MNHTNGMVDASGTFWNAGPSGTGSIELVSDVLEPYFLTPQDARNLATILIDAANRVEETRERI